MRQVNALALAFTRVWPQCRDRSARPPDTPAQPGRPTRPPGHLRHSRPGGARTPKLRRRPAVKPFCYAGAARGVKASHGPSRKWGGSGSRPLQPWIAEPHGPPGSAATYRRCLIDALSHRRAGACVESHRRRLDRTPSQANLPAWRFGSAWRAGNRGLEHQAHERREAQKGVSRLGLNRESTAQKAA